MRFPTCQIVALLALMALANSSRGAEVGDELKRTGDEIMVCGQLFHTGAPVVLWTDPGGYDAYRTEKRFAPWDKSAWTPPPQPATGSPNRFGIRFETASTDPNVQIGKVIRIEPRTDWGYVAR